MYCAKPNYNLKAGSNTIKLEYEKTARKSPILVTPNIIVLQVFHCKEPKVVKLYTAHARITKLSKGLL